MIDPDFPALTRVVAASRIGGAVVTRAEQIRAAWRDSGTGRVIEQRARAVSALQPHERVRFGALMVGWMALGHWALLFFVPPYVTPGIPRSFVIAVAALAFTAAAAARPVVQAWPPSLPGRVLNALLS